ncbi:hypothetical protein BCA37_11800 [Mycobacterium sp. djl-10]|nr:hypothetical protein BCA37_11800 [Mycobacterium sp. djl-10]
MSAVYYSRIIDAAPHRVWDIVGDFGSLPVWFPFVRRSNLSEGGGPRTVGTVRTNHLDDGTTVVEKLIELSDRDRRMVYDIIDGDAPVTDYTATISLFDVAEDNRTFVTWAASFSVLGEEAPVVEWVRNGIFRDCLAELARTLGV